MFELVHFSINIISKTCTVVFNVPKVHNKTFDKFELVHFSFKSSPILAQFPQLVQNMNTVINGYGSKKNMV